MPRVYCCGPFVGAGKATFRNTLLLPDASDAAAEAAALRVRAAGATFMKFYEGLTEPMIRALERACARHGLEIMGHVPAGLTYEAARIPEVRHFFGVALPSTLERETLINRSCDWHEVDERRMDDIVKFSLKFDIANTPTIVTNQKMLCDRDYDAARRQDVPLGVPPFYLEVIWHPGRGRFNNRFAPDYLERQVVAAIAKKQRLTKKLFDAGAKLFLGTDVAQPFVVPGKSLQEEMALFGDAGIGLERVWKLATSDAGDRLGRRAGSAAARSACGYSPVQARSDRANRKFVEPRSCDRGWKALSHKRPAAGDRGKPGLFRLSAHKTPRPSRRRARAGARHRPLIEDFTIPA